VTKHQPIRATSEKSEGPNYTAAEGCKLAQPRDIVGYTSTTNIRRRHTDHSHATFWLLQTFHAMKLPCSRARQPKENQVPTPGVKTGRGDWIETLVRRKPNAACRRRQCSPGIRLQRDLGRCWIQPWGSLSYDAVHHWSLQKKSGPKAGLRAPKVTIKCFVSLHPPYVTQKHSSRDLLRFFPFIVMSYKAPPFALFNVNTKQDHSSSQVLHKVSPLCRSFGVQ
jgi:hypothetical protein